MNIDINKYRHSKKLQIILTYGTFSLMALLFIFRGNNLYIRICGLFFLLGDFLNFIVMASNGWKTPILVDKNIEYDKKRYFLAEDKNKIKHWRLADSSIGYSVGDVFLFCSLVFFMMWLLGEMI